MQFDLSQRAPHQVCHRQALIEGFKRHGIDKQYPNVVACWGWHNGLKHRQNGRDVLVLERGYLGDRFAWTSIAWNGLNGRAQFPTQTEDGDRLSKMGVEIKPWSEGGDYVLLIGQVRGDAALQGRDLAQWYTDAAEEASRLYGLPVRFRAHPLEKRRIGFTRTVKGTQAHTGTLDEALSGAEVVITYNSNAGVDALLAGCETVAVDPGSMAWPLAAHTVGAAFVPGDREAWANELAWRQWSMDEIRSGEALVGVVEDLRNGRIGEDRRACGYREEAPAAA